MSRAYTEDLKRIRRKKKKAARGHLLPTDTPLQKQTTFAE